MKGIAIVLAVLTAACGGSGDGPDGPDSGTGTPVVTGELMVGSGGVSNELTFEVPVETRSLTVIVTGEVTSLYALASLRTADGVEHVGIDLDTPPGPAMRSSYNDEQIGHMEGDLYQSIRLGTFTHVYPYRPDQTLPAGTTSLRVASDAAGPVTVTVFMPEEDGSDVLHLNLIAVSESLTFGDTLFFMDEVQAIFDQAGISAQVDDVLELRDTGLSTITDFTEPQERPESMTAMLPALVDGQISNPALGALDVFIVDSLPFGVGGLSLGTPGPPIRGSYYYGVVLVPGDLGEEFARVFAHEVAHFVGLQHVENVGISGLIYPDPLDDTAPGQGNLMENGAILTEDQNFALSRSALLRPL